MPPEDRWFVWLNWLVAAAIAVAIVFFQGRWLTADVYTVSLGRCDATGTLTAGLWRWHVSDGT
jgi:hypothetical protein